MKNPKNILITGGSSGIGEALAYHYASKGVFLALSGQNSERLTDVAETCRQKGAEVETALVDVCDEKAMSSWIMQTSEEYPLDLVIANAGISGGTGGRSQGEPIAEARRIFDVNVSGVFNTLEPALKVMNAYDKKSQIAIISSLAGFRGWPGAPAYSASKGAVRFYGEALRGALRNSNIQVNVVCPGFVTSRMTDVNDYKMPLKMSAKKAAEIIAIGLSKNKGRICFPLPVHFTSWFLGIFPDFLAQKILSQLPDKPALVNRAKEETE
jgi:short-subunit dehydrogenase